MLLLQTVPKKSCPLKAQSSARKTSQQFGAVKLLCVAAPVRLSSDGPTMLLCGSLSGSTYNKLQTLHTQDPHGDPGAATAPKVWVCSFCSCLHSGFENA